MFHNRFDCHMHSDNSHDAKHSVSYMAESAEQKGFMGISITDHCDINEYAVTPHYEQRIIQSILETKRAQVAFGGRLLITNGIELGQPLHDMASAKRALSLSRYDFVIGSLHNLKGEEDFYWMDYSNKDLHALMRRYCEELYEMVQWGQFDTLAHITYPLRYIYNQTGSIFDLHCCDDILDEIFRLLVQKGIALELNTSGLRQPIGVTLPSAEYLRRYRELGGELITLGSDAHNIDDLGKGIEEGMALLQELGYEYFAFYRERKPRMIRIY